ncbi:MAG: DJ-1/PfpI family protein [Saprospiraceae bacterium]|nr:DJ-1/PfpI family protein [Saprospiraceae bacterium]
MSKSILIITGDAGESYETLYALHRFEEAGLKAKIAAPSLKRLNLVIHDFEPGWDTYKESPGYKVNSDMTFDDIKVEHFDAILLLGGRAPEYLRHDQKLIAVLQAFDQEGKWIFSICHGIQILLAAGIGSAKKLTCYEHVRFEVESNGGTFCEEEAVRDGHIVSAQTWQSHPDFYRLVFECLAE